MIRDIVGSAVFEIKTSFKKMSTYVFFFMFFAMTALAAYTMGGGIKGGVVSFGFSEKMFINSPVTILNVSTLFLAFGSSIIAAAFGQAICKDYLANIDQVIYSKPINIRGFLIGRFLGTLAVMTLVFLSLPLGIGFTTFLPGMQDNMVIDNNTFNYFQPVLVSLIPNIFILGSIYFLLASMTKKMAPVYIAGIITLMGWLLSGVLVSDIENKTIASLIDPFGLAAIGSTINYWSVVDKQTGIVWWESYYLYNRLAWMALGLACFGHAVFRFKPLATSGSGRKIVDETTPPLLRGELTFPRATQTLSPSGFNWALIFTQTKMELKHAVYNIYFLCLALTAVLHLLIGSTQVGKMFGTQTYPVTHQMISMIGGLLNLYMLIVITFWCGEVVWRDRDTRLNQIVDSSPTSVLSHALSKIFAVNILSASFVTIFMLVGILVQTVKGYYEYEIGLYLFDLFATNILGFFFISALGIFFQTVLNSKYFAHGAMILFYVIKLSLPGLGVTDLLFYPNSAPKARYSDMNGYGHFLFGYFTFQTLWTILAVILLVVAYIYWRRGTDDSPRPRWHQLPIKIRRTLLGLSIAYFAVAGFIYYNTHILNEFVTPRESEQLQVDYEKTFSAFAEIPQLSTISVFPKVDIFPEKQALNAEVLYTLKNISKEPIGDLFLNIPYGRNNKISIVFSEKTETIQEYHQLGAAHFRFSKPLLPGETIQMSYNVEVRHPGFENSASSTIIVENGSFIHSSDYFPRVGYDTDREISSAKIRAKYDLNPKLRMPKIDDPKYKNINYISPNSHWIEFEAIVSTSDDQIAIAPGYLTKEWREEGRRYFHYKMDQKILDFYSFLSGRYAVKKAKWRDVNIEIYYHPNHNRNLDTMIQASQDGLEYFSKNFSPYQYRQYRIIEFPRYAMYAQAFPNTIPFSEGLGFIAKLDLDDPEAVDYAYYITLHELAHQWWAHQVVGARVQGATLLSESLAQYSALMVMEKRNGQENLKRYLKYELDGYLLGRGSEPEKELPLRLNENQGYIHYQKASLVLYSIRDNIGEEEMNRGIRKFLERFAFAGPPYPVSDDLINEILKAAPVGWDHQINELFSKIVLFENRVLSSKVTKKENGKFAIEILVDIKKFTTDEEGNDAQHSALQADLDVGVRGKDGKLIYLRAHSFHNGENLILLELDQEPARVGIDPLFKMIDKTPDDNEKAVGAS